MSDRFYTIGKVGMYVRYMPQNTKTLWEVSLERDKLICGYGSTVHDAITDLQDTLKTHVNSLKRDLGEVIIASLDPSTMKKIEEFHPRADQGEKIKWEDM